jgi:hypothetical protein
VNELLRYKEDLLNAFLQLDCMQSRPNRNTFVTALEDELGHPLSCPRSDQARFDVWALLGACLAEHALDRLVAIVAVLEGNSIPMLRIRALVEPAGSPPAGPERDGIADLLDGIDPAHRAAAIRAAAGPLGPAPELLSVDSRSLVDALAEAATLPGAPPVLLGFLRVLAERLDGPVADELRRSARRLAEASGLPAGELDRLSGEPAGWSPPEHSFVLIELREDGPRPDRYLLSVWVQHDDQTGRAVYVNDDDALPVDAVPDQLARLVTRLVQHGRELLGAITIEFLLPQRLLGHAVDQWPLPLVGTTDEFGVLYPVVIRSIDRMHNQMVRPLWHRRWQRLRADGGSVRDELVHWLEHNGAGDGTVLAKVLTLGKDCPVCLVVPFSTEHDPVPPALAAGLSAGLPVMLWCRDARAADAFAARIRRELDTHALLHLPARVLRLRQDAAALGRRADHVGRHLSLLWDDPHRLPPDPELRAPAPAPAQA